MHRHLITNPDIISNYFWSTRKKVYKAMIIDYAWRDHHITSECVCFSTFSIYKC